MDLEIFFLHQLEPEATAMAGFPSRDRKAFMAHWQKIMSDESVTLKSILCDRKVAGNVVSWPQDGHQEVGYWLGREFWGRGIATRALEAFVKDVEIRPLRAHVAAHNVASIRVLEKCGFKSTPSDPPSPTSGAKVQEVVLVLD